MVDLTEVNTGSTTVTNVGDAVKSREQEGRPGRQEQDARRIRNVRNEKEKALKKEPLSKIDSENGLVRVTTPKSGSWIVRLTGAQNRWECVVGEMSRNCRVAII